jgi:23S rRNA (adenine2503-C2)-methyltransferase
MDKKDIKNFTLEELKEEFKKISEPSYRAEQVFSWIYKKGAEDFNAMNNIPKLFMDKLSKSYYIGFIKPLKQLKSSDETEKILFELEDGNLIEAVLICSGKRKTACISTACSAQAARMVLKEI